jgi:DNA-binding MarR family transcriptional regulator
MSAIRYVNHVDMSNDGTSAETDRLLALFFMAWRGFAAEADAILAPHGLGRLHHRILYAVARLPGIRIGDLATTLGITRQGLHGPLAELERRRLVVRRVAKESARDRAVFVTKRGASLEDAASSAQRRQLERAFAELGDAAARGWIAVQRALAAAVVADAPQLLEGLR